ncbi:DUF1003 domain-containing protein [Lactococcus termiticola]|uniref:Cyclic nucleotide-binding protein n=1 Tax=Lactococcus termiticola TaxID=2169526 RepID=A0A2R5HJ15_9LACT|nr:DUF1003 domain-containing protein [Lactococcus termiticola]GBG96450.1 cyclic nucleotide-binding protein [Lactococcus termiticola]
MPQVISSNKAVCLVNGRIHRVSGGDYLENLDPSLQTVITRDYPDVDMHSFICNEHQVKFRLEVLDTLFHLDLQKNFTINDQLNEELEKANFQIQDVEEQLEAQATIGERAADRVTDFVGSWAFIIIYTSILAVWMFLNVSKLLGVAWDPYPFILLNLFLSITAAMQAPLIMMSQNRASDHDRLSAKNDYLVNTKSDKGVRALHEKLDHLMMEDQSSTMQIQKIQTEMLGDIQILLNEVYQQNQDIRERLDNVEDQLDDFEETLDTIEENTDDDDVNEENNNEETSRPHAS